MVTRIRYYKTSEINVVESVKKFQHPTNGAKYKIRINLKDLEYFIIEDMSDTLVASGRATNLHQVKIRAKKTLTTLGIEFDEAESRNRKSEEVVVNG